MGLSPSDRDARSTIGAGSRQAVSEAASEAQSARVYAGIHFREGCVAGSRQGTQIARFVVQHSLRPLKAKD